MLKDEGYCNERGEPFNPQSVRAMIEDHSHGCRYDHNAPPFGLLPIPQAKQIK
jgi:hypothetical protein